MLKKLNRTNQILEGDLPSQNYSLILSCFVSDYFSKCAKPKKAISVKSAAKTR
jgi:hypothetical protein